MLDCKHSQIRTIIGEAYFYYLTQKIKIIGIKRVAAP